MYMKKLRVYLDTSVIGGCFDKEFANYSNALFDNIKRGEIIAVISDITTEELNRAPAFVQENFLNLPIDYIERVVTTQEVIELANSYLEHQVVSQSYRNDALHIAIGSVYLVDILLSWNFKHIVNLNRIRQFNSVNMMEGYPIIEIRSPREVISDD